MIFNYNELIDLNFDNYDELTSFIDNNNYEQEFMSPIAILGWKFYGINFKFKILEDNTIIFYINKNNGNWNLTSCFYNKQTLNLNNVYNIIESDMFILNKSKTINYDNISQNMIIDWNIDHNKLRKIDYFSNYIYLTESFKTFKGKKLQKKRNHYNNFVKQNYNLTIKKINDVNAIELLDFCKNHINEYQNQFNDSEFKFYEQLLNIEIKKNSKYVGIVVYINNKIIGFTVCYLRKNICDIVIEKANHNINGSYQFIIKENLNLNNVNQEYIDREDDGFVDGLKKSKLSYYPIYTISRYSSKV